MPSFFSRLKGKDGPGKISKAKKGLPQDAASAAPAKPQWVDSWTRPSVEPEEVQELLRGCTVEMKSRGLDLPFLLLPFRPTSDPSAARTFIRHFFERRMHGEILAQELRLTEPMVLCSVVKWCWSRLPGGVVGWEAYQLFREGETDSNMARDSFATFIPLSVESDARTKIIFDYFDLLSAIAAHGKANGLGGRKLSRLAAWWCFEFADAGSGFEGGYKTWQTAADAASHLFFAYLRSLSPDPVKGTSGISTLPMALQKLVQETEYPPEPPSLLQSSTKRVVMIVDSVSPTPFALLRRANHFQFRDDDRALQEFSEYDDPVQALTEECRRVLRSISSANQSQISSSKESTGLRDASWSRFEDIGFSGFDDHNDLGGDDGFTGRRRPQGLQTTAHSIGMGLARPTTPSWADFMSSGFNDESKSSPAPLLLPPDKILPPIDTRGRSSQSHKPGLDSKNLEPGELANITRFDLDDSFWWVWISSLAGEETPERKAAFGRCAVIETVIRGGRWIVVEEMVKGAANVPEEGAYIAEKKSFWGRSKKNKGLTRRGSTGKHALDQSAPTPRPGLRTTQSVPIGASMTSIGPDQYARIQAAAAQLQQKQRLQDAQEHQAGRRGRNDVDVTSQKTNSVFTLQPVIMSEASPAMKWANKYDKDAIREAYLANSNTGRGLSDSAVHTNGHSKPQDNSYFASNGRSSERTLPAVPASTTAPPPVPAKVFTPPPPSFPPTPAADEITEERVQLSEKAAEVALPRDAHPLERKPIHSVPPREAEPEPTHSRSRPPPAHQNSAPHAYGRQPSVESHRSDAHQTESGSSPESKKQNKLHKREPGTGGFRQMFGRSKIRNSKVPANAGEVVNGSNSQGGLQPDRGAAAPRRRFSFKKAAPVMSPVSPLSPADERSPAYPPSASMASQDITPVASPQPQHGFDRSYDPSVRDSLSRVDTADAHEARQAFSRFDQGPLDVPAFAPDEDDSRRGSVSEDDATPPAIARGPRTEMPPPVSRTARAERAERAERTEIPAPVAALPRREAPTPVPARVPAPLPSPARAPAPAPAPAAAPAPVPAPAPTEPRTPQPARNIEKEKDSEVEGEPLKKEISPVMGDRWAQIRKNAADRAAQKQKAEEQRNAGVTSAAAGEARRDEREKERESGEDGETSGEETIESRVARIKARVAELTGNMEHDRQSSGVGGPRTPPVRR